MTDELNRDELISLLDRLGSPGDEEVLEAARTIHQRLSGAGANWDALLVPEGADEEVDDEDEPDVDDEDDEDDEDDACDDDTSDEDDEDEPDIDDEVDGDDEGAAPPAEGDHAEARSLIDKLLARSGLGEATREELEGYKEDIAEGEFDDGDLRYLRAMSKRLSKR